jgi:polyhydroxyalkanoate synthesis regulator phasin
MAERGSQLVELVQRLGRDEVRALVDELGALWRGDSKVGDRTAARLEGLFRELGLVTRAELEDAELKVAQLEHRLRLLEHGRVTPPGA